VVSGVGFLGAGVILRDGVSVRGVNTAATIWCSSAVGVLAGAGYIIQASIGALLVAAAHLALRPVAAASTSCPPTAAARSRPYTGSAPYAAQSAKRTSAPWSCRPSPVSSSSCVPSAARTSTPEQTWCK